MHARDELAALRLPAATVDGLVTQLERPPHGVLDPDDKPPESTAMLVLHAALLAARNFRNWGDALCVLLDELEPRLGEFTSYDVGRFWHLRGLEAWRHDAAFPATRALNRSIDLLEHEQTDRANCYLARVHDTFGQLLHQQGLLGDARLELSCALELRRDDAAGSAATHGNLGRLCMDLGDFEAAHEHFERDLAIVETLEGQTSPVRIQLLSHLAECELRLGAIELAEALFAKSHALAVKAHDEAGTIHAEIGAGRIALARCDAPKALEVANDVLQRVTSPTLSERGHARLLAAATRLAADAHLACRQFDAANDAYHRALRYLGDVAGSSPMEYAEAFRGLAAALAAREEQGESARHLRLALRHLDGTAAEALRRQVELELESSSRDSWLLHAAGRFIGQHHIERLLEGTGLMAGYRGEQRRVAVLFSDIRGFTTISEGQKPTEVIDFLNDFFTHMTRCVERHDGTVDKFIGDCVMAVFPLDEHGKSRAIDAALAMREELERLNRYLSAPLTIGTGIHSGEVVAGLVGSPQKREFTVIGDVVNTASRLEGMSKQLGATLLVSADVKPDPAIHLLRPLGAYAPKGKLHGLEVFDVMGMRDRSPASKTIDAEIGEVTRALDQLRRSEFADAALAFERLQQHAPLPRSTGYKFLAGKARELIACPPPAGWTGAIPMLEK